MFQHYAWSSGILGFVQFLLAFLKHSMDANIFEIYTPVRRWLLYHFKMQVSMKDYAHKHTYEINAGTANIIETLFVTKVKVEAYWLNIEISQWIMFSSKHQLYNMILLRVFQRVVRREYYVLLMHPNLCQILTSNKLLTNV